MAMDEFQIHLLAVDDDPEFTELLTEQISMPGLEISAASNAEEAISAFRSAQPEIVLLDLSLPGATGFSLLEQMSEIDPRAEIFVLTGHYSPENAVQAIKMGASDYLTKPIDQQTIRGKVEGAFTRASQRKQVNNLEGQLSKLYRFSNLVGRSPLMLELFSSVVRVAPHFRTALVTGPTGTGKELIAKALHGLSPHTKDTFATVNCAAIVETLAESELFGHVRGAFTGATHDKIGVFEFASGGTVFLDEIGELPLPLQAKLLRVLQNFEVQRVGSPTAKKVDVRVIGATHRNLRRMVKEGTFREDLYYRLAFVELCIPPLNERREDIPLLASHFLAQYAREFKKPITSISRRAQAALMRHPWPGNVRQLEHTIGKACMYSASEFLDVRDLPEDVFVGTTEEYDPGLLSLEQIEKRHAQYVLAKVDGNKVRAAEVLGISRGTLYKLLETDPP